MTNFKLLKRIACFTLIFVMIFVASVVQVSAATDANFILSYQAVDLGKSKVIISLTDYAGTKSIDYLQLVIYGSPDEFDCVTDSITNELDNPTHIINSDFDATTGKLVLLLEAKYGGSVIYPEETDLVSFNVNNKSKARFNLTVDYVACYRDGTDSTGTFSGEVVIACYGDVNGDGVVDVKDLLRYKLYLADNSRDFIASNAELTGDGAYNADDIAVLIKLLLGIDVELPSYPGESDSSGEVSTVENANVITVDSGITTLRDPFVLTANGTYYMYGTGYKCYKNTSGSLAGEWTAVSGFVTMPTEATADYWAPEVHLYNGYYYMFATYYSSVTSHRGTAIFRSSSPEGPFVQVSDGPVTPDDWDSIDGTLYIDPKGQPWIVFVHEWTSTSDGIGRMCVAKLSEDLTEMISTPVEIFRADEPGWGAQQITDGCFVYTTSSGELVMLWSNKRDGVSDASAPLDTSNYCVAIAHSESGDITGPWTHDAEPIFPTATTGEYDGGHAMVFRDLSGKMYMAFHSPNTNTTERKSLPVFRAVEEVGNSLVFVE